MKLKLNKSNTNLKNEIDNIKKDIENIKNYLFKKLFHESTIITNFEETINLKKWIYEKNSNNVNKEIK